MAGALVNLKVRRDPATRRAVRGRLVQERGDLAAVPAREGRGSGEPDADHVGEGREGGREGGRKGGREKGREGGREGGRERER